MRWINPPLSQLHILCEIACVLLFGWLPSPGLQPVAADDEIFYRDVQATLVKSCIVCHGPSKQESGYRIDLVDVLLRGGDSGQAAVVPGDPEASHLWQRIVSRDPDQKMPPRGSGLDAAERARLRGWIAAGAALPQRGQPRNPRSDHWAFWIEGYPGVMVTDTVCPKVAPGSAATATRRASVAGS